MCKHEVTAEELVEFANIYHEIVEQEKVRLSGHKCWFFLPSPELYEKMKKYANAPKCTCGKGVIRIEMFKGNIGDAFWARCTDCKFEEPFFEDMD